MRIGDDIDLEEDVIDHSAEPTRVVTLEQVEAESLKEETARAVREGLDAAEKREAERTRLKARLEETQRLLRLRAYLQSPTPAHEAAMRRKGDDIPALMEHFVTFADVHRKQRPVVEVTMGILAAIVLLWIGYEAVSVVMLPRVEAVAW